MTSASRELVVATRNAGKLRELVPLLASHGWRAITLDEAGTPEDPAAEEAIESGRTFDENALRKARWFARFTTLPVAAEDAGLEVAALGGRPGVWSKRWAAPPPGLSSAEVDRYNVRALLRVLEDSADRSARFSASVACVWRDRTLSANGAVEGEIAAAPRGLGGFGYDPIFVPLDPAVPTPGRTFAELGPLKGVTSHRRRAWENLLRELERAPRPPADGAAGH